MTRFAGHSLALKKVTHRFGDAVAANDVDLDIQPGELISLLGPSGCGKTTLLKIIAGFLRQTSGDVLVDGASITPLPANRRRIGIVFQNYALFPHMTVEENVAYGLAAARPAEGRDRRRRARDARRRADGRAAQPPAARTVGRATTARRAGTLPRHPPRILLLDEPFSALDKNLRLDMQIEIKRLQRRSGITTVLVTHDQEEALSISDRIAVLSRGNLEQFATPADIYDRPASLFVNTFVGTANLIKGTVAAKSAAGTAVRLHGGMVVETKLTTPMPEGAAVLLSIRPEGLGISRESGSLPAHVTAVIPIGPSLIYEVALADGTAVKVVQDRADNTAKPFEGEVFLVIKPSRISGLFSVPSP